MQLKINLQHLRGQLNMQLKINLLPLQGAHLMKAGAIETANLISCFITVSGHIMWRPLSMFMYGREAWGGIYTK